MVQVFCCARSAVIVKLIQQSASTTKRTSSSLQAVLLQETYDLDVEIAERPLASFHCFLILLNHPVALLQLLVELVFARNRLQRYRNTCRTDYQGKRNQGHSGNQVRDTAMIRGAVQNKRTGERHKQR